jgi:hypothetical protein
MTYEMQGSFPIEGSLSGDFPAKTCPLQENELAWMEREAASTGKSSGSLTKRKSSGSYLKMYQVCSPASEEPIWEQLLERWPTGGIVSDGVCLMLNTSEFPKGGGVSSSLRDVLETQGVLPKYYLSAKACEGILRRAERRGKKLPEPLDRALRNQSDSTSHITEMGE